MRNINNYEIADRKNDFLRDFDIKDVKFPLRELFAHIFDDFIRTFTFTTYEDTLDACITCIESPSSGILSRDLFDYGIWSGDMKFLVGNNMVYSERNVIENGKPRMVKTFHDVYVVKYQYADLALNEIASYLFFIAFPQILADKDFTKPERKYPNVVHNLKPETLLRDLDRILSYQLDFKRGLTLGELCRLITDPSEADKMELNPIFSIYANGHIFLKLDGSDNALVLTASDFIKRDWKEVEKRNVVSVKTPNGWYNGCQKDAPYMDHPLVKKLKDMFFLQK